MPLDHAIKTPQNDKKKVLETKKAQKERKEESLDLEEAVTSLTTTMI